jgi:hypothetical protein
MNKTVMVLFSALFLNGLAFAADHGGNDTESAVKFEFLTRPLTRCEKQAVLKIAKHAMAVTELELDNKFVSLVVEKPRYQDEKKTILAIDTVFTEEVPVPKKPSVKIKTSRTYKVTLTESRTGCDISDPTIQAG